MPTVALQPVLIPLKCTLVLDLRLLDSFESNTWVHFNLLSTITICCKASHTKVQGNSLEINHKMNAELLNSVNGCHIIWVRLDEEHK